LIRNDVRRFSELKERLTGISDNVLPTVLNELVKEGLIEKQIFSEIPLRVEELPPRCSNCSGRPGSTCNDLDLRDKDLGDPRRRPGP
jgi:hypothetical protein